MPCCKRKESTDGLTDHNADGLSEGRQRDIAWRMLEPGGLIR